MAASRFLSLGERLGEGAVLEVSLIRRLEHD
jgi:hypothetical protein